MDIPSKNNNQSSVPVKVPLIKVSNQFFNNDTVKDHVSTNNKDVGIPNKKDADTPNKMDVNILQHKDVNKLSVHVNIHPSQTNKPNYKPSSLYHCQNIVRKNFTLKINAGNDKDSLDVTLHRTQWKYMFDIKIYIMERNSKYTYDRQTIKYMGKVLSNKDIKFEEMNSKSDINFDM